MAVITLQRVVKEDGGRCLSQSSKVTHIHTQKKKDKKKKEETEEPDRTTSLIRTSVKVDRPLAAPSVHHIQHLDYWRYMTRIITIAIIR